MVVDYHTGVYLKTSIVRGNFLTIVVAFCDAFSNFVEGNAIPVPAFTSMALSLLTEDEISQFKTIIVNKIIPEMDSNKDNSVGMVEYAHFCHQFPELNFRDALLKRATIISQQPQSMLTFRLLPIYKPLGSERLWVSKHRKAVVISMGGYGKFLWFEI